ncbi:hypothetical protein [Stenotrophomonas sp. NRRL B-14846]|uniref:LPD3 domain-containing protein n=1 Tax=Stenotrophomonas sp. NRRL B-14846 TaxID=3162882 RepID=UPI003D288332
MARDYLVRMRDAGTVMHNDDKGWDIGLTRRSINELVSFRPEKLLLVPALPQITKAAVLGRSRPNADTSAVNPSGDSVVAYHDFYAPSGSATTCVWPAWWCRSSATGSSPTTCSNRMFWKT